MNDQRLRLDLTELAEEVTVVDLRDRTLRTSRRLGVQRAVATSAAALVLIAAAAGTAFAVRPDQSPPPLPADTPSVTANPTPTQSPSSTPSTSTSGAPGSPDGGSSPNTPTAKIGKLFYGPVEVTSEQTWNLRSWRPGESPVRLLALPDIAMRGNSGVSSDGRRVAWVSPENELFVSDVDGSDRQRVRANVDPYCVGAAWSPGGRQLLFRELRSSGGPGRYGVVDMRSAGKTVSWWATEPEGCNAFWAADGQTIAMTTDYGVTLYGADGRKKRVVPGFAPGGWHTRDIVSLSPNGSRIALLRDRSRGDFGDGARDLRVNVVLDTRTGKEFALPLGGRELRQVHFQSDGSMVVRVKAGSGYAVLLVGEDGRKISETAEPAALKDMQILAVVS
ncbi:TolB family protein [Micromonospora taraxaci]|uniref:TolB family protein n=1 Tax=Micromonospora taraxaci TaxID=1316803 RepID=UPI0033AD5031